MTDRNRRILLISIGVAVALTRLLAIAHSLWEWDEALFCLGLRDFNVAAHHPHPPGFPLYVVLGKLFRLFIGDDFRALQAINVLSAMLVFPAVYMLAREMELEFVPSVSAALLTCFAPNVWFYGGTAFSDVPTLTFLLFGAALLLRGRTSRGAYYAGCVVMAAACVMRPQNVLLGAYPFLAASWPRWKERKRDPILGALIMFVIIAGFFAGAAYFTGFAQYREATRMHGEYVMAIDSYHNPGRTVWYKCYRIFLLDPYGAGKVSTIIAVFALIGLLRHRRPVLEALAIFGPFVAFSFFMLNPLSGGRYAITSMPMLMICCAEGVRVMGYAVTRLRGGHLATAQPRNLATIIQVFCLLAIIGKLIYWTLPALAEVRNHDAPTYAAARWIRQNLDPRTTTIYHRKMGPWLEYLLNDYREVVVDESFSGVSMNDVHAWMFAEGGTAISGGQNFVRPRGHLFNISRKRYFEVSVRPMVSTVSFLDGWYAEESNGTEVWRWMGRHSEARLAPVPGKSDAKGELALTFDVPRDQPRKPTATIAVNGNVIDRFVCDGHVAKRWVVQSAPGAPNTLTIDLDEAVNPAAQNLGPDSRDLGLQLRAYSWRAAEEP